MLALFLVAVSVGLGNLGASAAIGLSGVDRRLRLRIALIFGLFEGLMPIVGLLVGRSLAHDLGGHARQIGGALLGLVGAYMIGSELFGSHGTRQRAEPSSTSLVLLGAALSIDNLVIGFALGASHTNLVAAAVTIGVVSIAMSLLGLEIGNRLGPRLGQRSGLFGGAALILVGVGIGTGLL